MNKSIIWCIRFLLNEKINFLQMVFLIDIYWFFFNFLILWEQTFFKTIRNFKKCIHKILYEWISFRINTIKAKICCNLFQNIKPNFWQKKILKIICNYLSTDFEKKLAKVSILFLTYIKKNQHSRSNSFADPLCSKIGRFKDIGVSSDVMVLIISLYI